MKCATASRFEPTEEQGVRLVLPDSSVVGFANLLALAERSRNVRVVASLDVVRKLFDRGVWSTDSAGYLRQAVSKRYWHPVEGSYVDLAQLLPALPCHCFACHLGVNSFQAGGLWGTSRLALHNVQQYR